MSLDHETGDALRAPECSLGYPLSQLERELTTRTYLALADWMSGQTGAICDGRRYSHETKGYEETGCGPHGFVWYASDVDRFLRNPRAPVLD